MIKKIIILAFVSIVFSCKNASNEDINRYQVISLLFEKIAKPIELVYPPNPSGRPYTKKDSMHIDSLHEVIKKERAKRKFIVAVYPNFNDDIYKKYDSKTFKDVCPQYYKLIKDIKFKKNENKIDIDKIKNVRNDSIILFSENLLNQYSKEYENFDFLIVFSKIIFNQNYTSATILVHQARGKLAGESILYFLEKIDDNWVIKCGKVLGVS